MINIAEVLNDPIFLQPYQIERQTGGYVGEGEFSTTSVFLDRNGSIQPANQAAMNFLPEGLRSDVAIQIWDKQSILMGDGDTEMPDIVIWQGGSYRVAFSKPWSTYGYWYAVAAEFHS